MAALKALAAPALACIYSPTNRSSSISAAPPLPAGKWSSRSILFTALLNISSSISTATKAGALQHHRSTQRFNNSKTKNAEKNTFNSSKLQINSNTVLSMATASST
jgi:hypothetical protein